MKGVSAVRAAPSLIGRGVDLRWKNPAASAFAPAAFAGVRVVRKERTFPEAPDDGDVVYSGLVSDGSLRAELADRPLKPLTTYYYTLFTLDSAGDWYADSESKVAVFATESYDLAQRFYQLLPAVHQRLDRPLRGDEIAALPAEVQAALRALPPALAGRGQLRRFLHAALAPLDLMRSFAEGLPQVHDAAAARPEFLLPLAQSLGWSLDRTLPVYRQRNEIRDAPRQYRAVGTIPSLRSIVNRYARWYTQVAELDERIARSNAAPALNLHAVALDGGIWRGAEDAAPFLGFGAGNDQASGAGGPPASAALLTGNRTGPFRLRPGMELAISTDGRPPARVRFHAADFADITQAETAEVAAVLGRLLPEIRCEAEPASGGERLVLRSLSPGERSSLEVLQIASSLLTLESAPRGRLATFADASGRHRVFYEVNDPLAEAERWEAARALDRQALGVGAQSAPLAPRGQVRYKTFRGGEWGPSIALPQDGAAQADPAAVVLPDGQVFVAWVESPGTGLSKIRFRTGAPRLPQPARLAGRRSGPFPVRPGMRLLIRGHFRDPLGFEFTAADFASPAGPTPAEVAAALSARLPGIRVTLGVDGTLRLDSAHVGGEAQLDIDLGASTAAEALGFEEENHAASGDWGDAIDWGAPEDLPADIAPEGTAAQPRYHADLHAMVDQLGRVRLFWSAHAGGTWGVFTARRMDDVWTGAVTLSGAEGGAREPFALSDAAGRVWVFWSWRPGVGAADERWMLQRRRLADPAGDTWSAAAADPILPAAAADRQPAALLMGDLVQLFFRSNRMGSTDIWSCTFDPTTDTASGLSPMWIGAAADHAPTPLLLADGRLGMFFRSDRGFDLSRAATRWFAVPEGRATLPVEKSSAPARPPSFRIEDTGTLRRFAGTTSVVVADESRRDRMRQWDDLVAYTPQKPMGEPLEDGDLYTRGTVGLFLSPLISMDPLTQAMIERLSGVLRRFLPINVRAVVILAPRVDVEYVYAPQDIVERYEDDHPDIDRYAGPTDSAQAELPEWSFLLANTTGHISWNPADTTSLFHRVFFEPPQ
ncbi:hypothetical protein WME94_33605 [Sorangium sp. So ce429]